MGVEGGFVFRVPASIRVGLGSLDGVAEALQGLGARRPLIVTDAVMGKTDWTRRILDRCAEAGLAPTVFDGITSEPTTREVEAALALYGEGGCDSAIGFGGGSSLDTAKSLKLLVTNGGSIVDYEGREKFVNPGVPMVAIPTTAGTGSEVTRHVAITDPARNVKMLITSAFLIPEVAVVDPGPMAGMPAQVTAATGIDALTHAIEAYVSKRAHPLTDSMALSAVRIIAGNLVKAFRSPGDLAAREAMAVAALQAGIAFSNASVALAHAMARPIGAWFGVPHGMANAMLLAVVMSFSLPAARSRYAEIGRAMGAASTSDSDGRAATAAVEAVGNLCRELGIKSLAGWGVDEGRLLELAPKMAADAIDSGSPANNPRSASADEITELYAKAYRDRVS